MNWPLLGNSLLVTLSSTTLAVAVGFTAAVWFSGLRGRWQAAAAAAAILAFVLPPFLVTNCWLDLLGAGGRWRRWIGLDIYSKWGTIWVLGLMFWPITFGWVAGAWQRLDSALLDAEPSLTSWRLLRHLLVPMARPALAQSAVLSFVLAFNNFAVPSILQTQVFPAEAWIEFNTRLDYGGALRLSWPTMAAPLLLWWILRRFGRGWTWPAWEGPAAAQNVRSRLGSGIFWGAGLATLFILWLSVWMPLADLIGAKRTWVELAPAWSAGVRAAWTSVLIASGASGATVLAGLLTWRWRISGWVWAPFFVPGVVAGMAMIFIFNRPWSQLFYQSIGVLMAALAIRCLPIGWTGVASGLRALDAEARDWAVLNGARWWELAWHVYRPLAGRQALAGWYLGYIFCLWDVETEVLLAPPGGETISLRIFNLLHYGHNPQVNALCLLVLALALLPLGIWGVAAALGRVPFRGASFRSRAAGVWICAACCVVMGSGCGGRTQAHGQAISSKLFRAVELIGERGTGAGQFNKPRSLALDLQDNLYVVDMTGRVQKFSSNGVFVAFWQMPETEKGKPKGMCRDGAGNIVVIEPHYTRVNHFDAQGRLVRQWGKPGTNDGQLSFPRSAAVNSKGHLLISEYGVVERVQEFSALGERWIRSFGHAGEGPGEFNRVEGVAVDKADRIYLADSCNHRVQVFTGEGKFLRAYGRAGSGPGAFGYPHDIQVDARGRQYVCEFGNSRIQVFDSEDHWIETLGGPGAGPGEFNNPWSIALDSAGNLYVADGGNHRVEKYVARERP